MRKLLVSLFTAVSIVTGAWSQVVADDLVFIEGGPFKTPKSDGRADGVVLPGFYIGRYEVTQKQWTEVMGSNPSHFPGDDLPVEMVSWYDCIEYCNRRSVQEGLRPYYSIDKENRDPNNDNENDEVKWTVTVNAGANGYRLPTEAEWEYAAAGGRSSQGYTYSGGNDLDKVGWYWQNAGDEYLNGLWNWPAIEQNKNRTRPVGRKAPNELGLYDMSGNVREWCWDWYQDQDNTAPVEAPRRGFARVWKGGGWMGGDFCCEPSFRSSHEPNSMGHDQGFRVCRSE